MSNPYIDYYSQRFQRPPPIHMGARKQNGGNNFFGRAIKGALMPIIGSMASKGLDLTKTLLGAPDISINAKFKI